LLESLLIIYYLRSLVQTIPVDEWCFRGFMATQTPRYLLLFRSLLGSIVIISFSGVWVVEFFKEFALETDILSLDLSDGLLYIHISAYERSSLMVASSYTFADQVSF